MVWETFVVETAYEPAHTIGGDFGLVAPRDHHLNLLVCDVSGHGISAALIANRIYMETVALVGQERLDQLLHKLNRMVLDGIQPEGFFFTMAVARIDRNRRLTYAGAGHPPAILVTPAGEVRMLASRSGALGLMDDPMDADPTEEVEMSAGDRLLLMTDGLTEVFNNRREMLGDEGLNRIVKSHVRAPLAEMKQAILDDVAAWRQGPATDDVSMVLVEVG
jgi:sigma-B regulation protein RsbU (phosphoserine phosphatase)